MSSLLLIFVTGLTTGGMACLAVQGGLLASLIANQKQVEQQTKAAKRQPKLSRVLPAWLARYFSYSDLLPVALFLGAKLVTHTALGALLGWFGGTIAISLSVQLLFQMLVAFFMIATAMNLLNVHPIFRYVHIQPPRWLFRYIRKSSKSEALFAPILLGALTIFIPCGVTQSMELLAISSGSAVMGTLIMFFFVLGTIPLFAFIGLATAKLSETWEQAFAKVAATVLILMSLYTFNGVAIVLDSPFAVPKLHQPLQQLLGAQQTPGEQTVPIVDGVQQVNIEVLNTSYQPSLVTVQQGIPVKLTLRSNDVYSCALSFVLKEFGIQTFLEPTDEQSFEFTPEKTGEFTFTCSMGMYTGTLRVI